MKLVSFEVSTPVGRRVRVGAMRGEHEVIDLAAGAEGLYDDGAHDPRMFASMANLLQHGDLALTLARRIAGAGAKPGEHTRSGAQIVYAVERIKLSAPLPRPNVIQQFSTFLDEGAERRDGAAPHENWLRFPAAHKVVSNGVIGPNASVRWPHYAQALNLRPQIACVVGKQGRNLTADEATAHIAGFTIFIDPALRLISWDDNAPGPFKNKSTQAIMGPWLTTMDEFNERDAEVTIKVNGEVWFEGNTGQRRQHWAESILAYTADNQTVYPGDVLALGQIGRSGSEDLGRWVKAGDQYEVQITGLGTLSVRVGEIDPPLVSWGRTGLPGNLEPDPAGPDGYWSSAGWPKELEWMERLRAQGAGSIG